MKMPTNSSFCLEILSATDVNSAEGTDPSPELLAFLARKGMRTQKVSTCEAANKGHIISIEMAAGKDGGLSANVCFEDITPRPGLHFAIIWHKGVYRLTKDPRGNWVIESYTCEVNEPPQGRRR
jgi:hypothetical protein